MLVPVKSIFAASCYVLSIPFFSHFMQMQLTFLQILSFLVGPSFGLPLFLIHLTSRTGSINCYLLEVPHIDLYACVIITIIIYHPLRAQINQVLIIINLVRKNMYQEDSIESLPSKVAFDLQCPKMLHVFITPKEGITCLLKSKFPILIFFFILVNY